MTGRNTNARAAGALTFYPGSVDEARQADYQALEMLPPLVRSALCDNLLNIDTRQVLELWRRTLTQVYDPRLADVHVARVLYDLEARDVGQFSATAFRKWGNRSPHLGADASVQRYGDPAEHRHRPKLGRIERKLMAA